MILLAKTRVATVKPALVPCPLLSRAVLAVQMVHCEVFQVHLQTAAFWKDSTIMRHRMHAVKGRFDTFIADRLISSRESSKIEVWRHVQSVDDQTDLCSRGITNLKLTEK